MAAKPTMLTAEGLKNLEEELAELQNVKRKEIAEKMKIKEAINSNKKSNGNITFFNSMDRFDFFALFVSLGCLVSGAIFSLPSISENFERLMKYSLLAISSSVFTLTIIRIQTNKITRIVHYAYENAKLDGGNF